MNYNARLQKFQQHIQDSVDLVFLPFSADLRYLMGVPRDMPSFGAVLHPGMWLEGAWLSPTHDPVLALPRMTAEFGGMGDLKANLRILGDHDDPATLLRDILSGFKLPARPRIAVSDSTRGETLVGLQGLYPAASFSSATTLLNPLRRVKGEKEIAVMRRAGEVTEAAFEAVLNQLKHGMTELEVISEVDLQLRRHGALGPSFVTSMYNSGPNYPLIFGKREEKWLRHLEPPVALLFDFGAAFDGYCYDYGRTVAFGQPDVELLRIFDLVMQSQAAGIAALKAGNTAAQTDAAARAVIEQAGYDETFRHRLGHGIGLDVHEAPFLTASDHTVLEPGMLFTIEPSIMQFDNFSTRVEDVVVVGENGGQPLTTGFQPLHVVD
jgi:Xaa-Pro aminopeptidase